MKAPGVHNEMISNVDAMFADKKDLYVSQPSQLLTDIYNSIENSFVSLNENPTVTGAVKVRCMVQESKGNSEFFLMSCDLKTNGEVRKSTMLLRESIHPDEEIVSHDGFESRCCLFMVDVPGANHWYINDSKAGKSVAAGDAAPTKKARLADIPSQSIPKFIAKFVGEESDHDLPINTVVDLHGLLTEPQQVAEQGNDEVMDDGEPKEQDHLFPVLHVLKYEVVHPERTGMTGIPEEDMKVTAHALTRKFTSLLGDATSAEWLLLHLMSTTYARPSGMPVCFLPLNIVGVSDSSAIISVMKAIMPKVKVLTLTPALLSEKPFASFKDYQKSDYLTQGELQLANGTLLIIDETQMPPPEERMTVNGYAESNLKVLEQLILEQRIMYKCASAMIPFDVDYPLMILSKKASRLFKTPFQVPCLPSLPGDEPLNMGDEVEQTIYRQYIQTARANVKEISISQETAKKVQEDFVQLCSTLPQSTEKSDLLNELLIVSRLLAAAGGSKELQGSHFEQAIRMEKARKEVVKEWFEMNK